MIQLPLRMKRLRKSATVREMLQETHLHIEQFIAPLFIHAGLEKKQAIASMPGYFQLSLNDLDQEITTLSELGIKAVILFGIPSFKDAMGSASLQDDGIIQLAIRKIKALNPNLLVIADLCFCEYTDHGHCGILKGEFIDNDLTLNYLGQQAISYAKAGADWIAPSAMTDGMVAAIRQALDSADFIEVAILSYAVKYASSLYGPFREAALGAPKFGDRKTYMMNPANAREGLREARLDIEEASDILMVKPAMLYLDVIYRIKQQFPEIPLCAYQVSGEFAMIKAAAEHKCLNENDLIIESLLAIRRAGADLIISYFAKELAVLLKT